MLLNDPSHAKSLFWPKIAVLKWGRLILICIRPGRVGRAGSAGSRKQTLFTYPLSTHAQEKIRRSGKPFTPILETKPFQFKFWAHLDLIHAGVKPGPGRCWGLSTPDSSRQLPTAPDSPRQLQMQQIHKEKQEHPNSHNHGWGF